MKELMFDEVQSPAKFGFAIWVMNEESGIWERQPEFYSSESKCLDALHKIRETKQAYFNYAKSGLDVVAHKKNQRKKYYNKYKSARNPEAIQCQ